MIAWFAVVFGINSTSNAEIIVRGSSQVRLRNKASHCDSASTTLNMVFIINQEGCLGHVQRRSGH